MGMKDTVIILGTHPRTRGEFDFSRTDCDIWIFNEALKTPTNNGFAPRADAVFQLHIPTIWKNPNNRNDPNHYQWLQSGDTPEILMQEAYPDVPKSVRFPREEVLWIIGNARANGQPIREVSCSPSWALAYAIYKGYKRIEIYGVELESNTEYSYQQGNFKFWVGVAVGRGIEVEIHSTMFDNPQYGYEGEVEIPYTDFDARLQELNPQIAAVREEYKAQAIATTQAIEEFGRRDNSKELLTAVKRQSEAGQRLGLLEGMAQANEYYKRKADAMLQASDNFVFSRQEFEYNAGKAQKQGIEVQSAYNAIAGQLEMMHSATVNSAKDSPKRRKNLDGYKTLLNRYFALGNQLAGWAGAAQENQRYMARLDKGVKAAGGIKSEEAIHGAKLAMVSPAQP